MPESLGQSMLAGVVQGHEAPHPPANQGVWTAGVRHPHTTEDPMRVFPRALAPGRSWWCGPWHWGVAHRHLRLAVEQVVACGQGPIVEGVARAHIKPQAAPGLPGKVGHACSESPLVLLIGGEHLERDAGGSPEIVADTQHVTGIGLGAHTDQPDGAGDDSLLHDKPPAKVKRSQQRLRHQPSDGSGPGD